MELIILPSYSYAELHATVNTRHCSVGAILLPVRRELSSLHSFTARLTIQKTVLTAIFVCLLK